MTTRKIKNVETSIRRAKYFECEMDSNKHILEKRAANLCVTINSIQTLMMKLVKEFEKKKVPIAPVTTTQSEIQN